MAITAKFVADFTDFDKGVKGAEKTLVSFETAADQVGGRLMDLGGSTEKSGGKILQFTNQFRQFDSLMSAAGVNIGPIGRAITEIGTAAESERHESRPAGHGGRRRRHGLRDLQPGALGARVYRRGQRARRPDQQARAEHDGVPGRSAGSRRQGRRARAGHGQRQAPDHRLHRSHRDQPQGRRGPGAAVWPVRESDPRIQHRPGRLAARAPRSPQGGQHGSPQRGPENQHAHHGAAEHQVRHLDSGARLLQKEARPKRSEKKRRQSRPRSAAG